MRYFCPVCEQSVDEWKPFTRNVGVNKWLEEPGGRLCPHCFSFERTRHIDLYLKQLDVLKPDMKMLHFAPERGLERKFRAFLASNYITTDLFQEGVDAREDITDLSFESDQFDFIYCSNVLEHVDNDRKAMSELFRVLSPGKIAIIQVPIKGETTYEDPTIVDPDERYNHFGQSDHVRYYGADIKDRLENAGFIVEPIIMPDVLSLESHKLSKMNLNKRELIHKCIKPL